MKTILKFFLLFALFVPTYSYAQAVRVKAEYVRDGFNIEGWGTAYVDGDTLITAYHVVSEGGGEKVYVELAEGWIKCTVGEPVKELDLVRLKPAIPLKTDSTKKYVGTQCFGSVHKMPIVEYEVTRLGIYEAVVKNAGQGISGSPILKDGQLAAIITTLIQEEQHNDEKSVKTPGKVIIVPVEVIRARLK